MTAPYVDAAGNAVGELGAAGASRVIVLLGHIDTVPGNIPVRIDAASSHAPARTRQRRCQGPARRLRRGGRDGWAHAGRTTQACALVVVGAVEEEAATSKGARFIASRFDGGSEPRPSACVIGEPSSWRRITLGYKGRLLLDLSARQPMAHTAGPDASVAEVVIDLWNWVRTHAGTANAGVERPFDQLTPSLRRFVTANEEGLIDTVDAQFAWRLPVGFDALELVASSCSPGRPTMSTRRARYRRPRSDTGLAVDAASPSPVRARASTFAFRGWEQPWRGDRQNALVRSFLAGIRAVEPAAQPGFVVKTGTSDMNVVAPIWQCPIVAYGPGDSGLDHTPNEHLELDEYWHAVRILEATLRQLVLSLK